MSDTYEPGTDTAAPPPPADEKPAAEQVATETVNDRVARARAEIEVAQGIGVDPAKWAQMVTIAQDVAKGKFTIPEFLRGNVGDAIAIVNQAVKTGLDPWLIAGKCYIQKDRLCMESQLHHALLAGSRYLQGSLNCEYLGEADERVCIVTGYLKGDPQEKVLRSPPLKQVRPARNDQGVVKGSPLWDKDPDQQLWYYASRAWQRRFCPQAALGGIWAEDEVADMDILPPVPGLRDGLATDRAPRTGLGFRRDFADRELAGFGYEQPRPIIRTAEPAAQEEPAPAAAEEDEAPPAPAEPSRSPGKASRRAAGRTHARGTRKAAVRQAEPIRKPSGRGRRQPPPPTRAQVKAAADRAERRSAANFSDAARAYVAETLAWIAEVKTPGYGEERWAREYPTRQRLSVPPAMIKDLRAKLDARIVQIGKEKDDD